MYEPLPIEIAMWARYAKFQPQLDDVGVRLPNCTRTHFEIDADTGEFVERDRTGAVVDSGVIERGDEREAA